MSEKIKVIYIVGSGRSGSTILDTVLGNQCSVESVGELINAPRAWANEAEHCACGDSANSCVFWREVREEWAALTPGLPHDEAWCSIQQQFERPRHIGRALQSGEKMTRDFQRYAQGVTELYRAIQRVSGNPVILDSSKNPVRALALSHIENIDLRLIHLVRDGRGVAWSLKKSYKKDATKGVQRDLPSRPIPRSAASWWLANTLAEIPMKRMDSSSTCRIRYEDFVSAPLTVLRNIGEVCGLDVEPLNTKIAEEADFLAGHTIAGNRMRMAEKITIRPDVEWPSKLTAAEKRVFWFIAGRVARRYGYERSV